MLVGDTSLISLTDTASAAFLATGPTVAITRPDAVIELQPPAVTAQPGGNPGTVQTLTGYYLPALGGAFTLVWSYNNGVAGIQRRRMAWAYWSDVPTAVRDLLQVDSAMLPDELLDRQFQQMYRLLYSQFPYLGGYYQLDPGDADSADEVMTYLVAVALWPVKTYGAEGALNGLKVGGFEFKYGSNINDERNAWTDRAAQALGYVPSIAAARLKLAQSWNPYQVSGPSRAAERAGVPPGLLDNILNVYQDKSDASLLDQGGA